MQVLAEIEGLTQIEKVCSRTVEQFSMQQGCITRDFSSVLHVPSTKLSLLCGGGSHSTWARDCSPVQVHTACDGLDYRAGVRSLCFCHPSGNHRLPQVLHRSHPILSHARILSTHVFGTVAAGRNTPPKELISRSIPMEASLYLLLCHRGRAVWQFALPWTCRPLWHFAVRICFCPGEVCVF